jgi:sugar phosphate isomerase/epimerase
MRRLSISELTTFRWPFDKDVGAYHAAGVGAIGVWRRKLAEFGEQRAAEVLAEHGLAVSNLYWAGGFTGSDGRSHREATGDAVQAVRSAATLKADCLVVSTGPRNGHTINHARRLFTDAMKQVLPVAEELNVTLALEATHPGCAAEWSFLTSIEAALEMIDVLGCPLVKLAFDTYHLGHDPEVVSWLRRMAPQIAIVHLADCKRTPTCDEDRHRLGEGNLPLREIIAALLEGGYEGYFDVKLLGEQVEATDYRQLIETSKRAFQELCGASVGA